MCVVCVEIAKGTLNYSEVVRALAEIALDPSQEEHAQQVFERIDKVEKKSKSDILRRKIHIQPIG